MKHAHRLTVIVPLLLSLIGCNTDAKETKVSEEKPQEKAFQFSSEPVTVTIGASMGMFPDADLDRYIIQPVKKKYPQITIQRIDTSQAGSRVAELVAAGTIPDIVTSYPGRVGETINDLGLVYNMEPLIKKFNFDMGRLQPEAVDTLKIAANQDFIAGLPAYTNGFALFYNKSIFDRFGVPYPKDGMFWDEVLEVAKKVTRADGGVQYRGISHGGIGRVQQQLGIPFVDFTTNKSLLLSEQWRKAFEFLYPLYVVPGLADPTVGGDNKAFYNGTLAMFASHSNTLFDLRKYPDLGWDMVTYPQHRDAPGVGQRLDSPIMSITAQSKNKDAAFAVLETIFTDEVQMDMMHNGRLSVLKDEKVKQEFGKGLEDSMRQKNLTAMTKLKFAKMAPFKYLSDSESDKIISTAFNAYMLQQKDLNTTLREADEQLNKLIQQTLKK